MKYLSLWMLIVTCLGCKIDDSNLSSNDDLLKIFAPSELEEYQFLFDFFHYSICSNPDKEELATCYEAFCKNMQHTVKEGKLVLNINFDLQKEAYGAIPIEVFHEIWVYETVVYHDGPREGKYKTLDLNLNGKYLEFLEEVGKTNKSIEWYHKAIQGAGTIHAPSIMSNIFINYEAYNMDDIRVKFIYAIHCLTLNDQLKRHEKIEYE